MIWAPWRQSATEPGPKVDFFVRCGAAFMNVTSPHGEAAKTTPQMTRFRDGKVCNNLDTDEKDGDRIQSDYKCTSGLQIPEGKNSTLGLASA